MLNLKECESLGARRGDDPWQCLIGVNGEGGRQRMAASLKGDFAWCGGARKDVALPESRNVYRKQGSGLEFQRSHPLLRLIPDPHTSPPPPFQFTLFLLPFSGLTVLADSGPRCIAFS